MCLRPDHPSGDFDNRTDNLILDLVFGFSGSRAPSFSLGQVLSGCGCDYGALSYLQFDSSSPSPCFSSTRRSWVWPLGFWRRRRTTAVIFISDWAFSLGLWTNIFSGLSGYGLWGSLRLPGPGLAVWLSPTGLVFLPSL
ncbi:hypothetical protein CC2G_009885 [Coprinopsis cinerea AmutBmut pab1-1]|nr:hypothetical protein CC2G_009885 [Coprinopsis cinerea AmutBmut pab1-1]